MVSLIFLLTAGQAVSGTISRAGMNLAWGSTGAAMRTGSVNGPIRWRVAEPVLYQPEFLDKLKLFVVVSRQSESAFHIWAVSGVGKMLTQIDVPSLQSGSLAAVSTGETVSFVNPGQFARAPILNEKNGAWLASREQLEIYSYQVTTGAERWHLPELQVGRPLAGSGSFLWTARLTNPQEAYAGLPAKYEIDQVGAYSGKISRAWPYPADGADLGAYRWRAEIHGADCTLRRFEPWPDAELRGNRSPEALVLRKIAGARPTKKRLKLKRKLKPTPAHV